MPLGREPIIINLLADHFDVSKENVKECIEMTAEKFPFSAKEIYKIMEKTVTADIHHNILQNRNITIDLSDAPIGRIADVIRLLILRYLIVDTYGKHAKDDSFFVKKGIFQGKPIFKISNKEYVLFRIDADGNILKKSGKKPVGNIEDYPLGISWLNGGIRSLDDKFFARDGNFQKHHDKFLEFRLLSTRL